MSDGPHRSLAMRSRWKKVAEFADNESSSIEDIQNALLPALRQDWYLEIPYSVTDRICEVLGDGQSNLFGDQRVIELEDLVKQSAGHGLLQLLVDSSIKLALQGETDLEATFEAVGTAVQIWAARHVRQIEEHYCRESTEPHAEVVRARMEAALLAISGEDLARELLNRELGGSESRRIEKQAGLDDGVKI